MNNVQRCLCHFYTWMRHSKQTATLLLTKRHANFDTSTSAKGYARVCTNCACAIVVLGILLAQARPTMPCIRLVIRGRAGPYGPIENHVQYIGRMGSKSNITSKGHALIKNLAHDFSVKLSHAYV